MYKIHSKQWENSIKVMMKLQHVVETEWPLLDAPGFSQSPLANVGEAKVSYWFKSLKNI
jgi:putative ribosome biogenesis GTPase RsgA